MYFDPAQGGKAPTGFTTIGANLYYFWYGSPGQYAIGLFTSGGDTYMANSQGQIQFGYINHNGYRYHFDETTGRMDRPPEYIGAVALGIDVSRWNGIIDWVQVKASGVKFAIIRAGYFASDENPLFNVDPNFLSNIIAAKQQGLMVGLYVYVYAYNEGLMNAGIASFHNSSQMQTLRNMGISLDLPVYLDVEDSFFYNNTGGDAGYAYRTSLLRNSMNTLRGYGYTSGFYTFYDWAVNRLNAQQLMNEGYSFWLARWPSDALAANPYYFGGWTNGHPNIWQFRSDGSVPGINGNVDMNYLYMV